MEKSPTFADRYQSVLVPIIFEPWARELIRRADPKAGEDILDLACGTGVVTRQVAKLAPRFGSLTGADHSAEMLEVARTVAIQAGLDATWVECDAAELPFEDDCFDLAFCQQALQFFPDRPAALRELQRVLKPGGRVAFCVQRELDVNPMLRAQAAALDAHVGEEAGAAVRAICSLPDADDLRILFEDAGFQNVEVNSVTLTLCHPDAKAFAEGAMGGMHTGDKLSGVSDRGVERAVKAFLAGLGGYLDGPALRFPHVSNVVTAST
ncbi:class I SAM-dependent methyltransferase [Defluviimonas sp. WL0002]|uniref:Class I SAM-dependent methyltransferase n=1 Tax=Albidovulum marisflavi TaxID=2984159 RepID=A0ABT2ZC82_9RHOB|nr:class I SAM-dependent methyltransferase [Defluviimonas sp. WL0002]MCV2868706.1 class I SAM-dependent methyltransferase [Defluviimonas sp. WL0002]